MVASAHIHDFVTLGFGPAGLAIAIAAKEKGLTNFCCLEQQDSFKWHPGMLIPGASMQISFLKDLATLRNPRSEYTFLNYLHEQGRLLKFLNLDTFLPSREEYQAYMSWAARRVGRDGNIQYNTTVLGVEPTDDVKVHKVFVERHGGSKESLLTRNVIFCTGGQPSIPATFPKHERMVHTSRFITTVEAIDRGSISKGFCVIGSGQSAAETWTHLTKLFPDTRIDLKFRSSALKPSDDSPFVNEVFDPSHRVDRWFKMPEHKRKELIADCRQTNYSVVRLNLLEEMYKHLYIQELPGHSKPHSLQPNTEITGFDAKIDGITVYSIDGETNEHRSDEYDYIFCATGYSREFHLNTLKTFSDIVYRSDGKPETSRLYRVHRTSDEQQTAGGIYLQGLTEASHGLAETLLSILATRGMEVVEDMMRSSGLHDQVRDTKIIDPFSRRTSSNLQLEDTSDYESERTSTPPTEVA